MQRQGSNVVQPVVVYSGVNSPLFVLGIGVLAAIVLKWSVHQVPEGHVGVYWRGGKLLGTVTNPGLHFKLPLLDTHASIQVTLQTDKVTNIPCGTKGGVMLEFGKVEVVNRLRKEHVHSTIQEYGVNYDKLWIYDKIHHEINQFCSVHELQEVYIDKFDQVDERMKEALQEDCTRHCPGLEIIAVRVTKPRIPDAIVRNYEAMEEQRTRVLVAAERQRVVYLEAEIEQRTAMMQAEQAARTSAILMEQRLAEQESMRKQSAIEDAAYLAKERALADARFYRESREAEANKLRLTPEYLQLAYITSIANNTKLFFGHSMPSMLLDFRQLAQSLDLNQQDP